MKRLFFTTKNTKSTKSFLNYENIFLLSCASFAVIIKMMSKTGKINLPQGKFNTL